MGTIKPLGEYVPAEGEEQLSPDNETQGQTLITDEVRADFRRVPARLCENAGKLGARASKTKCAGRRTDTHGSQTSGHVDQAKES